MSDLAKRADLPMLGALRSWLNSWRGLGAIERGMAHQGLRSPTHALRRARLARNVLRERHGALARGRDRHRVGANAVARDVSGRRGTLNRTDD